MRINVTKRDILEGVSSDCRECPIARAITRRLGGGFYARVGLMSTSLWKFDGGTVFSGINRTLPTIASDFVANYDGGKKCKPFAFSLDIPQKFLKPNPQRDGRK